MNLCDWSSDVCSSDLAMPLWLTRILDEGQIYKNSFSKYGEAFRQQLLNAG